MTSRHRPRALPLVPILAIALGCGVGSDEWSDGSRDKIRDQVCVGLYGLSENSSECGCVTRVIISYFEGPSAFSNSEAPPTGFLNAIASCGS